MADKAEMWRERLVACRTSGLSTAAFCRERGLSYAQYMYWQGRLGKQRASGLVPVRIEALAPAAPLLLEVTLTGVALRVQGATMADVVALVRGLAC